jgi:hypothetical protein
VQVPHFDEALYEKLEDMETQYGSQAGKLAMAMDLITDAEISAGQLSVYCKNSMDPRRPHPDLENLQKYITAVRALIKEAFRERENKR